MADLFGIIDAAQDSRIFELVEQEEHVSLFAGPLRPPLELVVPYLVRLDPQSTFLDIWKHEGWARNWGILCFSDLPMPRVRRHFRRFLQAMLPDGMIAQFRFYDPRVWRVYIQTCEQDDLTRWFTGIREFRAPSETGEGYIRYTLENRALVIEEH